MNALVEPTIIEALYEASQAGVQVELIIRGMCILRPGVKGLSENIRVRSIVGRLLEHARVFCFTNGGESKLWISSADWMGRNLFRRVEICTPIETTDLKHRIIKEALLLALSDNQCAWMMQPNGEYQRIKRTGAEAPVNMQQTLIDRYSQQ